MLVQYDNWGMIYRLLQDRDFPYLPEDKEEAIKQLSQDGVTIYKDIYKNLYIFVERHGKLYLDVCVPKDQEHKWFSKELIRVLKGCLNVLKHDQVLLEPVTQKAYNLCDKRFKKITTGFYMFDKNIHYPQLRAK